MDDRRACSPFQRLRSFVGERSPHLVLDLRDTFGLLPTLGRKPAVVKRWLLGARRAQIALLIIVLTVPALIPSVMDRILEAIYPPQTTSRLFGLLDETGPDPRLADREELARQLLWVIAGGVVVGLLWLQIPAAVAQAKQRARELETEADSLSEHAPSRSVVLYRSALELETDVQKEVEIKGKLEHVSRRLGAEALAAQGTSPTTPLADKGDIQASIKATVALSQTQIPGTDFVGQDGRYRLDGQLGRGAMGIVYRALDHRLDRPVALKQLVAHLDHEPEIVQRFRQEAKVLARLSHPNIVQVYDFFEDETGAWIAMELVEGDDLDRRLADGPLSVPDVASMGGELAAALGYAHAHGVVHRDFKPGNVLIDTAGHCKISDFGIAKLTESSVHTQAGTILGSPAYMSPEQAKGGAVDGRTDIYALGATLYRMATGRLPFRGDARSVLAQVLTQTPAAPRDINPDIPSALSALILHMMAKEPEERPPSATELAAALRSASAAV